MAKKTKKALDQNKGNGEEQKDRLSEVDKEWYQIQMKSLEEKLARREEKAKNLEISNQEYPER